MTTTITRPTSRNLYPTLASQVAFDDAVSAASFASDAAVKVARRAINALDARETLLDLANAPTTLPDVARSFADVARSHYATHHALCEALMDVLGVDSRKIAPSDQSQIAGYVLALAYSEG